MILAIQQTEYIDSNYFNVKYTKCYITFEVSLSILTEYE